MILHCSRFRHQAQRSSALGSEQGFGSRIPSMASNFQEAATSFLEAARASAVQGSASQASAACKGPAAPAQTPEFQQAQQAQQAVQQAWQSDALPAAAAVHGQPSAPVPLHRLSLAATLY